MSVRRAKPEHEVAFRDLLRLLSRHADKVDAEEMLAIAANMLGKLIAMQDPRTMTREKAMTLIVQNIEAGNQQAIEGLTNNKGSA
jgi:hypothetical protein